MDTSVAQLMAAAYGPGSLDDPKQAVATQQVVAASARPPDAAQFAQLAQMAYYAGETRTADLAAKRAIELAPEKDRADIRRLLRTAKAQTATQP